MENKRIENGNERRDSKRELEGPRNYSNPEPLNTSHIGRAIVVTLVNGRSESGKLTSLGAYMLSIELPTKKELIVNKGAIVTVSIL